MLLLVIDLRMTSVFLKSCLESCVQKKNVPNVVIFFFFLTQYTVASQHLLAWMSSWCTHNAQAPFH